MLFALIVAVAASGAQCGDREQTLKQFERLYGEKVVARGVMTGRLMEILASPSGTWSIFITDPRTKQACILAAGDGFDDRIWEWF